MLRSNPGKHIYTFANPTYFRQNLCFQELVTKLGLIILDMIPGFNRYALVGVELEAGQYKYYGENESQKENISFVESLVRMETSISTVFSVSGKYEVSSKELYGERAFNRIKNMEKDPAFLLGDTQEWNELNNSFNPILGENDN